MKIEVKALKALDDFMAVDPDITTKAASRALNTVVPRSLSHYRKAINSQVAFPGGYLNDPDKLQVGHLSSPTRLEASIVARQRPTSLARFVTSGQVGVEGLAVKVSAQRGSKMMKRSFLVRLNAGQRLDGENFNLGLAVRIPGGPTRGKKDTSNMVRLAKDVFLLYGPSVDQVFRAVGVTETPAVLNDIETEFYRQYGVLTNARS